MTEGFGFTHWSGYVTLPYWRELVNIGIRAQHSFQREWMALGGAPWYDPAARLYVIGSYLLAEDSLAMYANATNYQEFSHFPEFDLPLGVPQQHVQTDIDELRYTYGSENIPYYVKRFEHATVVVNPNASKSIVLPASFHGRRIHATSGTTFDGSVIETVASHDTLRPKEACLILNPAIGNLSSPRILSVTLTPNPIPADDSTNVTLCVVALDSSDAALRSDSTLPLWIVADLGAIGGPHALHLENDGAPGSSMPSQYTASFRLPLGASPVDSQFFVFAHSTTGLVTVSKVPVSVIRNDSSNVVLNYSFEIDNDEDGFPDVWRPYVKGYLYDTTGNEAKSGRRSIHVVNDSLSDAHGAYVRISLNQTIANDIELSGWSKAVNVAGAMNNDYSLYIDLRYLDGTPLYGQTAQFNIGTHDWEYAMKRIHPTQPVKELTLYALFRNHTGEAWFDHLALREIPEPSVISRTHKFAAAIFYAPFPNPVSDQMNFSFSLTVPTNVTLDVLDIRGRTLSTLVRSSYSGGIFVSSMETKAFTPGLYFARFQAGSVMTMRPFIIAR